MAPPVPHRTDIQMRFADLDALGHVNNVTFAVYLETARVELLRELETAAHAVIVARLAIDFRRPVHLGARVRVDTVVLRLGRTSLTLGQQVRADDELAAEGETVLVFLDEATGRPTELPAPVRAAAARYLAADPADPPV